MDEQKLSPGSPDGMLAASARTGDLDAFRELYHRYVRHVYDFMLRTVRDPEVARELTQSTFLRAHARLSTLRDPDRVREWLFGHAYRLATGQLRRGPVGDAPAALPRAVGPRLAGATAGMAAGVATGGAPTTAVPAAGGLELDDVERADLVWEAASSLPSELYAVLDVTARQGLDAGELAEDAGMPRAEVMAQLERAHEAFGRSVRKLLMRHSGEWCPGLASLLQTSDPAEPDDRARVDEHLGHCPRCRPLAEGLTTPAALSGTPLHVLDPLLARDGWDLLVAEMAKAAPRATRAALQQPEPAAEETAQLVASEAAMEYFAFPAPGAPRRETDIMRHESVRKVAAQADRARFRSIAFWTCLALFLIAFVIAAILLNRHHSPPAANLNRPTTTLPSTSTSTAGTAAPPTTAHHPSTTRPTRTTVKTTTSKPTKPTTTTAPAPVPVLSAMSPTSGYPGAPVTLAGSHFVQGDLVDFTGPTLPGGTERLTPSSLSSTQAQSAVPSFATFAGQQIAVAVQSSAGAVSRSVIFRVLAYWSGTWTQTKAKVSLHPSSVAYESSLREGQIDVFQTDVENEQCMVDSTAPVYHATTGTQAIAVVPKTSTCPAAEFSIAGT